MEYAWWLLPGLSGCIGLMLGLAGVGRLMQLRWIAGGARLATSLGLLGVAGLSSFAGLNLQTYHRLGGERQVATLSFERLADADTYRVILDLPGGERQQVDRLQGDQFALGARIITFARLSQLVGYDSVYRLDYIEGRFADRYQRTGVTAATSTGQKLSDNPGLDVYRLARAQGGRFGIFAARPEAQFGSAVYAPMQEGLAYSVRLTQSGLILRPANDATRALTTGEG
jgi:hypothetical protein